MERPLRDSFGARASFHGRAIVRLDALERAGYPVGRLPFSLRIVLENLLRREDGAEVRAEDIEALARWDPRAEPSREIRFLPARVLLQDFTGVPAIVDLAAMRDAVAAMGGDPARVRPVLPADLVIDHSVQVDVFGRADALIFVDNHPSCDPEPLRGDRNILTARVDSRNLSRIKVIRHIVKGSKFVSTRNKNPD
jgi:aconitate hydratase